MTGVVERLFDHILPQSDGVERKERELTMMLEEFGFDRIQHEQIRADLRGGRIGLAQNRLPISDRIDDVAAEDVFDTMGPISSGVRSVGMDALAEGAAAVVTLAAGAGSRWTKGAGTVKALHPFCRLGGKYRTFLETHIAKSRRTGRLSGTPVPHIVTTGYLTHGPIEQWLKRNNSLNDHERVLLSPGWSIGLRMVPMVRDLRFAWEEQPQQMLDVQAQKVLESLHASLIDWASRMGEASDYTDNLPSQCLHPVGHWYEIANLSPERRPPSSSWEAAPAAIPHDS
jgi:hypothetical protein